MATATQQLPPQAILNQMITGSWVTQAIYVAAELGIADIVKGGPQTSAEIAKRVDANADGLHRILRALASLGVFRETADGKFGQTPVSECLRSDVPGSMRAWARMAGAGWQWEMLGGLLSSARTGNKSFWRGWGYFEEHKEDADIFNQAMTSFSASEIGPVLKSYDFSGIHKLLDVAGGYGSLLAAVLKANPQMQGVLFDAPSVIAGARREIDASGIADRCELVAGDFFAAVPAGADAIMMKHIIHDWDDEHSLKILKTCSAALHPGGKLLVIDAVIMPGNEPAQAKLLDIEMLLIGGRERTEAEFRKLFAGAGFELTRIVATSSPVSVVEGRKV
jgi:SAM-dependent methyltransferase